VEPSLRHPRLVAAEAEPFRYGLSASDQVQAQISLIEPQCHCSADIEQEFGFNLG
jgi:hypothetical protein